MMEQRLLRLCDRANVAPGMPARAEVDGFAYAIFQVGDDYFVTADECSHGPGYLSEGCVDGLEIECPFHQGRFDLRTGEPTAPPCWEPVRAWRPVIVDDAICIERDAD
jgi:anthranilate 1,2-dioxygenase ferredoxin subunit